MRALKRAGAALARCLLTNLVLEKLGEERQRT